MHIGSRTGKTLQQVNNIVSYIKNNNLTECNINILEVPNNWQKAWEQLKNKNLILKTPNMKLLNLEMEELEQKYNIGDKNE